MKIEQRQVSGATSSACKGIYGVPKNSSITALPTSAGTATVYVSTSPWPDCKVDVDAGNITSNNTAYWQAWENGAVTAIKSETALGHLSAVCVKPASGTWRLEIMGEIPSGF